MPERARQRFWTDESAEVQTGNYGALGLSDFRVGHLRYLSISEPNKICANLYLRVDLYRHCYR